MNVTHDRPATHYAASDSSSEFDEAAHATPASDRLSVGRQLRRLNGRSTAISTISVVVVVALWEVASRREWIKPIMFSSPTRVADSLVEGFRTGVFSIHIRATLNALVWGYVIGSSIGLVIGFAAGLNRRAGQSLGTLVAMLYSTPVVALIPLIIIWFGFGMGANVFVVVLGVSLQVAISTRSGLSVLEARHLTVARSYGASRWRTFTWVVYPSARPMILSGLQLAVGRGLMAVVAMELLASDVGLGFYIARASATFQTANVFAGLVIVAVIGVVGTGLMRLITRYVERWRPSDTQGPA